jgi:hypothetical protein
MARQMGKGAQMIERGRNFRRAAKAVPHHARYPPRMRGAGADNARDFLGQGARNGRAGSRLSR